jgi:hypothetical protein
MNWSKVTDTIDFMVIPHIHLHDGDIASLQDVEHYRNVGIVLDYFKATSCTFYMKQNITSYQHYLLVS